MQNQGQYAESGLERLLHGLQRGAERNEELSGLVVEAASKLVTLERETQRLFYHRNRVGMRINGLRAGKNH